MMKKRYLLGFVVAVVVVFLFAPVIREEWANFGGGPSTVGWVSPSFALFQCGAFVGGVGIQMPNGGVGGMAEPPWVVSSNWNCQYPQWMG